MGQRIRAKAPLFVGLVPEITFALVVFAALRYRVAGQDRERGDAVQWVILAAIGAAMAITVGTIIFVKLRDKANSITTDTPVR